MKRISLLLVFFSFLLIDKALAQPTFTITPPVVCTDNGETVCVSVSVQDFTDIIAAKFSIQWDSSVVGNVVVMGLNNQVTGLDMGDFTINQTNGYLTFNWSNGLPCQTANQGVTLVDGSSLFQICFKAIGNYGKHTKLEFSDDPMDRYVTRLNANCNDIGEYVNHGFICIGTPPLTVHVSSADGFTDDEVCVDFKVEDFQNIVSFQFAIQWDSNILEYQNATAIGLPNWLSPPSPQNIGTTQVSSGLLNVSWLTLQQQGVTLPNNTSILQVCFKIKGACGQSTPITIVPNPDGVIEVINSTTGIPTDGTNIGLLEKPGTASVNCFNPNGIGLNIDDKNVCPGEEFTVDVKVEDFASVIALEFGLQWNPGIINLTDVTYPSPPNPCLPFSPAVTEMPGNGKITVDWNSGFGCTKPDNYVLMRLHFKATGGSGASTSIAIVNPIFVDKANPPVENVGINNNNGLVSICELTGLSTVAGSTDAFPGDLVCIPFTVENFEDLTEAQYTIQWEPNVLEFFSVQDFNLTDLSINNFLTTQVGFGLLGVEWESTGGGVTVPDGSEIFNVCFNVVGDPGTCTDIDFVELPWAIDIQSEQSNGTNVGLVSQPGSVCVDNPLSFITDIPDTYAAPGGQVCIEFTVENFTQLTNMDYTINWNSNILEYQNVTATGLPNFTASSFDASLAVQEGILGITWSSANQISGTTLPDGTGVFEVCFTVVGEGGECSPLVITDSPTFIDVTSAPTGGANLGLTSEDGSVCVSGSLHLVDALITPVECPSSPLGAIDVTISGGSGQYDFSWTGAGVDAGEEDQNGLTAGTYNLTVTDVQNPGITMEKEFEVGYAPTALLANAGQDTSFSCGGFILTLNGTASTGQNASYEWVNLPGLGFPGQVITGGNTLTATVIGGSAYALILTDSSTGCTDRDTVILDSPVLPVPDAGDSISITCLQDTVILDGTLSTFGYDVQWTTNGGAIVPGTETVLECKATAEGTYYLTLTDLNSGCARTDSVFVTENKVEPTAAAAATDDGALGCVEPFEVIDGAGSSTGADIVYAWSPMNGGQICGDTSAMTMQACSPGTFRLTVTDTVNGCFSTATVEIVADTLKPLADAGMFQTLTCEHETVTLDGTGSSGSANLSYHWETTNGNISSANPDQATVEADQAGLYQLTVTNEDNGCSAVSEVTVISEQELPDAEAAVDGKITCAVTTVTLDGEGSSTGNEFIYQWSGMSGIIGTALTQDVTEAGTYTFTVTNTLTGCTKTAQIQVIEDNQPPVANAGQPKTLTCTTDEVQLQGSADVSGTEIIYQWQGPGLGCITCCGQTLTPTVKCTGTYILTVADTSTGCLDTAHVQVNDDMQAPTVNIETPEEITCATPEVQLQGSTDAANFSAEWTATPATLTIENPNTLEPTVSAEGTYFLKITNDANGCSADTLIQVAENKVEPTADAGADDEIDCATPLGTLSAENSTLNGTTITWSAVAPATIDPGIVNDVTISVGVGTYILTVTDNVNGCTATDEAEVTNGADAITATAGADQTLGCTDEAATLNGTGSTSGVGIIYQWSLNGGIVGSELMVTVFDTGTYVLTVTNSGTGCTGEDEVKVSEIMDGQPATADFIAEPCSDVATLTGNLPGGATGVWTTGNGAIIADPTAATTEASNLHEGDNVFTWTLSLGSCLDYSSAQVTVNLSSAAPNANADVKTLTPDLLGTLSLNALDNDVFGGNDVIFNLLADPSSGSATASADGEITYDKEKCFAGTVEIPYAICLAACPDLCDTSSVKITVEADPSENCDEVPNGITPNDDGTNDDLIFDDLLNDPEKYPDNELLIFNRWGDVVFSAKPYQNDWSGTNADGQELPAGTYYYVMKLTVGGGEILRGDVTILR